MSDSMDLFFKKNHLESQFVEATIQSEWKSIVGHVIANHTTSIYLKGHRLVLQIDSAPLRNELLMSKRMLITNVNEHLKGDIVKEIVFV